VPWHAAQSSIERKRREAGGSGRSVENALTWVKVAGLKRVFYAMWTRNGLQPGAA
jgi:hypothetical protein